MSADYNLKWHTFFSHGPDLFRNLLTTQEFSDVTLVSEDHHHYKVHKFILSGCSSVFRNILTNNPLNMFIYLRGIHHEEVESILQFIYLGEATFKQHRMKELLNVAKCLEIKELGKTFIDEENENKNLNTNFGPVKINFIKNDVRKEEHENEDYENEKNVDQRMEEFQYKEQEKEDSNHDKNLYQVEDIVATARIPRREAGELIKSDLTFECPHCDHQTTRHHNLQYHIQSIHGGVVFPCQQCKYIARRISDLRQHIKSIHKGIKYMCQHCDYQTTFPSGLNAHIKSKHEGFTFPCSKCDYKAIHNDHLMKHIKSKH